MPLIAPPTPPQLVQDKASIDASFSRAFALIDQLATDTAELKSAETARTEKFDTALLEVETVLADLKSSNSRREEESLRMAENVRALKDMIPKALEGWKADGDSQLESLGMELKSLKTLVGNRVGTQAATPSFGRAGNFGIGGTSTSGSNTTKELPSLGGSLGTNEKIDQVSDSSVSVFGGNIPKRDRAAIPDWQLAASRSKSPAIINGDGISEGSETTTLA